MIKYTFAVIVLALAKPLSCNKQSIVATSSIPTCIVQKIDSVKAQRKTSPPGEVHQYRYNEKTVYLFIAGCCDQYNAVYDAQCNYICAPSGGLTGKGDMKCTDFNTHAKFEKVVWKDER